MARVPFHKMHGIGNDFVVLDARVDRFAVSAGQAAALADRHTGIGCDQVIVIGRPAAPGALADLRFLNADGSESGACGNGTRCVASLLMTECGADALTLRTTAGLLACSRQDGQVVVDMGEARCGWRDVPLAEESDTLHVATGIPELDDAACCSMGNPHATFFVSDADAVDLARLGPALERHPLFPERANIGVASIAGRDRLRLRVWERGAGITLACGSGACAALVAAARRGLTRRSAEIVMERGSLHATWREDGHVLLSGPVATSFAGMVELAADGSEVDRLHRASL